MEIRVNINTDADMIEVYCDEDSNELYDEILGLIGDYIYEKEHRENAVRE